MTNDVNNSHRWKALRAIVLSLCVGTTSISCTLYQTLSTPPVEPDVERYCADWATQSIPLPSADRDEAFIECIVRRDPLTTTYELRHRLATGMGNNLYDRFMTGEDLLISPHTGCPFVRVAVKSPAGSDELTQRPIRNLFKTALARAGFVIVEPDMTHMWWASSLALDSGTDPVAWTIFVRAVPEIGRGEIQFTSVQKTVSGQEGSFSGMQLLRVFPREEASEVARLAAEGIARELLDAAHRRCDDPDGAIQRTHSPLEQLRNELVDEIENVRREKARRKESGDFKQLQIEVEG